jgi:hypothetical protein
MTTDLQKTDVDSLDYFVQRRNTKKRNYIFDYGKSRTCDHPEMKIMARGGQWYRCGECNYAFFIQGATQQPLHVVLIESLFNVLNFSKEFGMDSVGEVLRRPIGQQDDTPHKPVLPEGMSFMDVLLALETVDVHTDDGGTRQLRQMLESLWVGPKERALAEVRATKLRKKQLESVQHDSPGELGDGRSGPDREGS